MKNKSTVTDIVKSKGAETEDIISKTELNLLKEKADSAEAVKLELEELKKAKQESDNALAKELEDLRKAKADSDKVLADIQKSKFEAKLADTADVIKGFNLVDEDKIEDLAKFLVANEEDSNSALILTTLEKARTAIQEFGEAEHGTDLEGIEVTEEEDLSKHVTSILKSRKQ